jgi:uncharacterized membrane protein SpoIIM required for sporulation
MIVNLEKFIREESAAWSQLEQILDRCARDPWRQMTLEEVRELDRLYQRASADLARLATFSAEPETRRYLENLVARAYAEVYGAKREAARFRPWKWFVTTWPQTFRRHFRAFALASLLMVAGAIFGGLTMAFDPPSKEVLMPFEHLQERPSDRVAREMDRKGEHLDGQKASFSGMLMTHNTQVALTSMALGMSWGVGTLLLMFYNGIGVGAIVVDYVADGHTRFLLGWLLPHGVVELPAVLVGGQAGFVLAGALLGRGQRRRLSERLRAVAPDVVTLCFGAALMLVWAGVVEAFLSQYHEPVIPYSAKIAFGVVEGCVLLWFLARVGREAQEASKR